MSRGSSAAGARFCTRFARGQIADRRSAAEVGRDRRRHGRFMFLIFWKGVIYSAIVLGVYLWALQTYGEGAHSRTIVLFVLVAVQLGNLFNCRSRTRSAFTRFFSNPFVFASSGIVIALQMLAVYFPPLSRVLDTVPLNKTDYLLIVVSIILPVIIVEITKAFSRMKSRVSVA